MTILRSSNQLILVPKYADMVNIIKSSLFIYYHMNDFLIHIAIDYSLRLNRYNDNILFNESATPSYPSKRI